MGAITSIDRNVVLAAAFISVIAYAVGLVIYRLYFSPIAKFPGPKLAAATHWYQAYYDLLAERHGGKFLFEIKRMHDKYGPIVRITPDELHIDDPEYWHVIYCNSTSARPMDKLERLRYRFGVPDALFSTPGGELHRQRRQAMASFFSKQRLRESNDRLHSLVERVSKRLSTEYAGTDRVLNVGDMFSSLAVDIVTELAFRRCTDCTLAPDFKAPLVGVTANTLWVSHWNAHFRFLNQWVEWLPPNLVSALVPLYKPIFDLRASISDQVSKITAGVKAGAKDVEAASQATIFNDILASHLPPHELSHDRLSQEAFAITSAGMETVKGTMTMALFQVLDKPALRVRIKAELAEAMPDPSVILPWVELEKLPYLSAIINESE